MIDRVETATIHDQAPRRSLVILYEVGRGTSTYDGMAIARAVVEDMHTRVRARTLFATHYLELTTLAAHLPGVANVHVAVAESDGRVIFLYAVRPGPADRAYGIQVARLAGLPPWVADRAEASLAELTAPPRPPQDPRTSAPTGPRAADGAEVPSHDSPRRPGSEDPPVHEPNPRIRARVAESHPAYELSLDGFPARPAAEQELARELRELDLPNVTPREAINWLFERQDRLRHGA